MCRQPVAAVVQQHMHDQPGMGCMAQAQRELLRGQASEGRVIKLARAPVPTQYIVLIPPVRELRAGRLQVRNEFAQPRIVHVPAAVGAEFGDQPLGASGPIDHPRPRCRINQRIPQNVTMLEAGKIPENLGGGLIPA